jgi:hypothetical protein
LETVELLRKAISSVDPTLLTTEDRLALLDLAESAFLQTAGGGGVDDV